MSLITDHQRLICMQALRMAYVQAVRKRLHQPHWFRPFNDVSSHELLKSVARILEKPQLAGLFLDAQFSRMPVGWCQDTFHQSYPPFSVCFGGEAMQRYQDFLNEGINEPCR